LVISAADNTCYNGFAFKIVFDLSGVVVPNDVIWGVAYNTTSAGYAPIGPAACFATPQGCIYDSLNVVLFPLQPKAGGRSTGNKPPSGKPQGKGGVQPLAEMPRAEFVRRDARREQRNVLRATLMAARR
jgi:hypothetical protein